MYNGNMLMDIGNMLMRLIIELEFNPSSNAAIRLSRRIPKSVNQNLHFNSNHTAFTLFVHLENTGIHTVGMVTRNRIPECKLPNEKSLKVNLTLALQYLTFLSYHVFHLNIPQL